MLTTNARPINGSEDADFRLAFKEKIAPWVWGPGKENVD